MSKIILAVDVGYGNTKLCWGTDPADTLLFRSVVRALHGPADGMHGLSMGGTLDEVEVIAHSQRYAVGTDAYLQGGVALTALDYIGRPEYLALLRGAMAYWMRRTGTVHRKVDRLVLGLPVGNYAADRQRLIDIVRGEHEVPVPKGLQAIHGKTLRVQVDQVVVLPQPMGAFLAFQQDNSLLTQGHTLIVDPGFNTLDWFMVAGSRPLIERSGSIPGGVSHVLRQVANQAGKELGVGNIELDLCEEGLQRGKLMLQFKSYDFTPYRELANIAAGQIIDRFMSLFTATARVDQVVLAGGGVPYYLKALQARMGDVPVHPMPQPVLANVLGFYRIGKAML